MILNVISKEVLSLMTTFSTQSQMIVPSSVLGQFICGFMIFSLPYIVLYICITCYNFEVFLYIIFYFCDILHMGFQRLESL